MAATSLWRRKSFRRAALQGGFLAAILAVIVMGTLAARSNLAAQGITSGFGFLAKPTGWNLNFSILPTTPTDPYWWFILAGICNTLFLGFLGLVFATLIGLAVGLARTAANPLARLIGTTYVEIFRNIPLIVQVFFWYAMSTQLPGPRQSIMVGPAMLSSRGLYLPGLNVSTGSAIAATALVLATLCLLLWIAIARPFKRMARVAKRRLLLGTLAGGLALAVLVLALGRIPGTPLVSLPELAGLNVKGGIRIQPELYVMAFAIAVYGGAYIGEIVRGGFKAVGRGQLEAASALGLSAWQTFTRVRLPLAIRAMLPILINQYVWLIKATTLGIVVGFSDFFMVISGAITHSGQTLELIAILMGGFLVINFSLAAILNRINRAIALKGTSIGVAH